MPREQKSDPGPGCSASAQGGDPRRKTSPGELAPPLVQFIDKIVSGTPVASINKMALRIEDSAKLLKAVYETQRDLGANAVLIATRVNAAVADRFDELVEGRSGVLFVEHSRNTVDLILWVDPDQPHEFLHMQFEKQLFSAIDRRVGVQVSRRVWHSGSTRSQLQWGNRQVGKEPDAAFLHKDHVAQQDAGQKGGVIVFEGAVGHESFKYMLEEMEYWFSLPQVEAVIGMKVKIKKGEGDTFLAPAMYVVGMERSPNGLILHKPTQFGTGSTCTSWDLDAHQIQVEVDMLFHGTQDQGKAGTTGYACIDLYGFREAVYTSLKLDPADVGHISEAVERRYEQKTRRYADQHGLIFDDHAHPSSSRRSTRSTRTTNRGRRLLFGL